MSPLLIIVGLPLVSGIVGMIHVWRATGPRYETKPVRELNWRTERPRIDINEEMEQAA